MRNPTRQEMINSYGSYQRSPGLMELAMMERRGEITASQFVEFAAKRKSKSKADDSKSQECTRPDGTKYRIALMRNGKKTTCGGAKTQKKQAETPKAKTAAAGVKKEADKVKEAGSFKGAIGGLKNGKQYDITPEMAAAAQKMGVSDRQLAVGRVPKAVQADLIKEFDRLSAGGKPETGEKGGAIVPVKSALQKAQEETNERKGRGTREKTPEERAAQFERLASTLVDTIDQAQRRVEDFDQPKTAESLKKKALDAVKSAQIGYDLAQKLTPKEMIKSLNDRIKQDRELQRTYNRNAVDKSDRMDMSAAINRKKELIEKIKADPEGAVARRIESAKNHLDKMIEASNADFESKAAAANREREEVVPEMMRLIDRARQRLDKVWDSGTQNNVSFKSQRALAFFGIESTRNPKADMEIARERFRDIARSEHPDMGGDPDKFRKAAEAWQNLRASQAAGSTPPPIDPLLQAKMEDMGYKFPSINDLLEDLA